MTPRQRTLFLASLRAGCTVSTSLKSARTSQAQYDEAVASDELFARAAREAQQESESKPEPLPREPAKRKPSKDDSGDEDGVSRLDVDRIERDAAAFAPGPFGFLLWMDSVFVSKGQHALSEWWKWSLSEFFECQKTWGLYRVGRGGGKSTGLERVAILFALFGCLFDPRKVPSGQQWLWPFISASTGDAKRRIKEIQALLSALGVHVDVSYPNGAPTMAMFDVHKNEIAFVSIAATVAGVSGPSAVGATVDEEAKLRDKTANVNPANEILASIAQMFRARAGIRAIRCSSAWLESGSHYNSIKEGDTDATYVAHVGAQFLERTIAGLLEVAAWEEQHKSDAPAGKAIRDYAATVTADSPNVCTWVANPTISALASRMQVEGSPPDPLDIGRPRWKIWLRENASVSMPALTGKGATADFEGLGEMNRKLIAGVDRAGLLRFDGLSSWDPRSKDWGRDGGEGSL